MKNLLLIRGVSGSGKSTFAKMLGGKNYEADHFFMRMENIILILID